MKFDKSKVYTAVNAEELKVGSRIVVADTLEELKSALFRKSVKLEGEKDCSNFTEIKDYSLEVLKAARWHSYEERPKESLNALCFDTTQNQFILGYYDIESDEWIKYGGYETINIDRWTKIVPPKEE